MINKQSLWFLTLFSLILVMGVYYITMPNELLKSKEQLERVSENIEVEVEENDMLVALRVERNEKLESSMEELASVLTSETTTVDEKNNAFEELKLLNLTKGKELELEEKIMSEFKIKSYIEINNDQVKVTINSKEHGASLANDIMRSIQNEFDEKMYITVKFES
ncbi:MAG: SpoIIIAH-like family protein [Bacilli bacterium]|nr:SpoIIIAH-like family protein [Bacilli bacterium]